MPGEFNSPKLDYNGNKKTKKKINLPKFVRLADESEQNDAFTSTDETEVLETVDTVETVNEEVESEVVALDKATVLENEEKTEVLRAEEKTEESEAGNKSAELETESKSVEPAAEYKAAEPKKEDKSTAFEKEEVGEKNKAVDTDDNSKGKVAEADVIENENDDSNYTDNISSADNATMDSDIVVEGLDDEVDIKPRVVRLKNNTKSNKKKASINSAVKKTQYQESDRRGSGSGQQRKKNEYQKAENRQHKSDIKPLKPELKKSDIKSLRVEPKAQKTEIKSKYRRKSDRISGLVKVLLAILIIAFAAYIASVIYFMSHFSWAISAEGEEQLYNMTAEDVKTVLQNQVQDYFIAVEARDLDTIYLSGHDIGMTCSFDGDIKDAIKIQNPWLWFTYRNNPSRIDLPVQIHLDEDMLAQFLSDAIYSKSGRKPTNAKFVDDPTQKAFLLQPEDNGSVIDGQKATEAVRDAIKTLADAIDLDAAGVYTDAEVTRADLETNGFYKELIDLCETQVNVDWHGIPVVIDKDFIYPLIQNDGQKAWIDYEPVYDYVKTLSRKYDKFGQPHKFIDTQGHEINVIMGAYGWLVDRDATAKGIYDLICKGGKSSFEPVYRYEAYARGEDDIGDSYAEINITRQHMYLYVDGKVVVESDFVSGNPMKGNGTHVGIYGITYKEKDATLNGQGYSSPVSYWMPFNGNEGMHDASWRSKFGGRIYKGGGSHGCINLPVDIAGKIYEYVEKGFPVIVFTDPDDPAYQEGDDKTSEPAEEKPATEEKKDKPGDINNPLFDANSGLYYILDPATNTPIFLDPETMQPTDVATAVNKLKALQEERAPE